MAAAHHPARMKTGRRPASDDGPGEIPSAATDSFDSRSFSGPLFDICPDLRRRRDASTTRSPFRAFLNIENDGLQQELEAENERKKREHDGAGRRETSRYYALDPEVHSKYEAPPKERQAEEKKERDRRKVPQHIL